jgi:subtilase family serine protease
MRARVKNRGTARATDFAVLFYIDGKLQSTRSGMIVNPGQERQASSQRLPPGTHVVKVVADPDNTIRESDETNNSREVTLPSKGE